MCSLPDFQLDFGERKIRPNTCQELSLVGEVYIKRSLGYNIEVYCKALHIPVVAFSDKGIKRALKTFHFK